MASIHSLHSRNSAHPGSRRVTRAVYEEMWKAYLTRGTAYYIKRTAGVSWDTAKRAIESGWPDRGMEPLRARLARHLSTVAEKDLHAIADARADWCRLHEKGREFLDVLTEKLIPWAESFDLSKMSPDVVIRLAAMVGRLVEQLNQSEARTLGVAEGREAPVEIVFRNDFTKDALPPPIAQLPAASKAHSGK